MEGKLKDNEILINFSQDEALILHEWLCSFNGNHKNTFSDQSEERILFDIQAILESLVSETFLEDYDSLLDKARERIRDKE